VNQNRAKGNIYGHKIARGSVRAERVAGNQDAFGFGSGLAVPRTAGNGAEVPVLEALRNGEVDLLRLG